MLKNCNACKTKHLGPFGSRCKNRMAETVVPGYDRDDKAYLAFLEDEFTRRKREDERKIKYDPSESGNAKELADINQTLKMITDRIGSLETKVSSSGGDHSTDHSPASLISDPLTTALAKLVGEETDKGRHFRPETYAQSETKDRNRDSSKMDLIDLFYGWSCIAEKLASSGGDIESYLRHVRFATEMMHTRKFYDSGAIKYDRLIIDKYVAGKSSRFEPDTVLSSLSFSANVIPEGLDLCHGASLTKGVISYQPAKPRKRRVPQQVQRKSEEVPPDFPADVCFFYNYRQCYDDNCTRAHTCRKCGAKHRADTCKERVRKS